MLKPVICFVKTVVNLKIFHMFKIDYFSSFVNYILIMSVASNFCDLLQSHHFHMNNTNIQIVPECRVQTWRGGREHREEL